MKMHIISLLKLWEILINIVNNLHGITYYKLL